MNPQTTYSTVKLIFAYSNMFFLNMNVFIWDAESLISDPIFTQLASNYTLTFVDLADSNNVSVDYQMTITVDKEFYDIDLIFDITQDLLELCDFPAIMANDILSMLNDESFQEPTTVLLIHYRLSATEVQISNSIQVVSKFLKYMG